MTDKAVFALKPEDQFTHDDHPGLTFTVGYVSRDGLYPVVVTNCLRKFTTSRKMRRVKPLQDSKPPSQHQGTTMSKQVLRRGPPVTKSQAVIAMLSNPGTKVCHQHWPGDYFIYISHGSVLNSTGSESKLDSYGWDDPWHILEEAADSPEKLQLTQEVEGLKAALAELEKKVEKLK